MIIFRNDVKAVHCILVNHCPVWREHIKRDNEGGDDVEKVNTATSGSQTLI